MSSLCKPRTARATASGSTTVDCVRSMPCSCFCIAAVSAASDSASAGEAAGGVVGYRRRSRRAGGRERLVAGRFRAWRRCRRICERLLRQHAEAHQRRGGVILPEVRAHPVDAAVVHQVGFLEAALARDDVVGGHDHIAGAIGEGLRLRRRLLVGEHGRPAQQAEADDRDDQQYPFQDVADRIVEGVARPLSCIRCPPC